jgi:hypothetical protein
MQMPFQHKPWMQGFTSHTAPLGAFTVWQCFFLQLDKEPLQELRQPAGNGN